MHKNTFLSIFCKIETRFLIYEGHTTMILTHKLLGSRHTHVSRLEEINHRRARIFASAAEHAQSWSDSNDVNNGAGRSRCVWDQAQNILHHS